MESPVGWPRVRHNQPLQGTAEVVVCNGCACFSTLVFLILALVAAFYFQFRALARSTGSGGIGAISIGVGELFALFILFLPPIVLTLTWYFIRRTQDDAEAV